MKEFSQKKNFLFLRATLQKKNYCNLFCFKTSFLVLVKRISNYFPKIQKKIVITTCSIFLEIIGLGNISSSKT